jgi:hypothetical protein
MPYHQVRAAKVLVERQPLAFGERVVGRHHAATDVIEEKLVAQRCGRIRNVEAQIESAVQQVVANDASVFLVEAGSIVVLIGPVAFFLARPKLNGWTPLLVGTLVATLIAATGDWTGGSFNPARQFGPALLSGQTAFLWCYLVGPPAGAAFLEISRRLSKARPTPTCQLCGG